MNTKTYTRWKGPQLRRVLLLDVTGQLLELVSARVPFVEGVRIAAIDAPNTGVRDVLLSMHEGLVRGEPLHKSMERLSNFFPGYYIDIVRSGEETGQLESCLEQLNDELENSFIWIRVGQALTYPVMAGGMILLMAGGLVTAVVPQFARIFGEMGAYLPAPTRLLIATSDILLSWPGGLLALAGLVMAIGASFTRGRTIYKGLLSPLSRLPYLDQLWAKYNLGRAASIIEKMLRAGIPLHTALAGAAKLDISREYAHAFDRARERVEQGTALRDALAMDSRVFIPSFRGLVALGETSGLLPQAFEQAALQYREQLRRAILLCESLIEPLLILLMGLVVGFIIVAMFMPIMGISSVVHH